MEILLNQGKENMNIFTEERDKEQFLQLWLKKNIFTAQARRTPRRENIIRQLLYPYQARIARMKNILTNRTLFLRTLI